MRLCNNMTISFDEFKKVEITVGKILSAEKVPETDKLLKLNVDFGQKLPLNPPLRKDGEESATTSSGSEVGDPSSVEEGKQEHPTSILPSEEGRRQEGRDIRQIISGISAYFQDPQTLVGKKCMFVTNLEPRMIKGLESNGMLFAVSTEDGKFSLLEPNAEIPEGTRAK